MVAEESSARSALSRRILMVSSNEERPADRDHPTSTTRSSRAPQRDMEVAGDRDAAEPEALQLRRQRSSVPQLKSARDFSSKARNGWP